MTHEATEKAAKLHDDLAAETKPSDELGQLTDRAVEILRDTGVVRMLQPKAYGGYEAHPVEFIETVIEVARANPSAGWVSGVVGVHPWELAMFDPRLQEEVWGQDPDTWTASPYTPVGAAVPVDGGYLFSGKWSYSTGTDHAQWVMLGGLVMGENGPVMTEAGPDWRHFVIPREDYEIIPDSWNVMGLKGTGSKDVTMKDVFVPEYRVRGAFPMMRGAYEELAPAGNPLYKIRWSNMFSAAISAATLGIAQGALDVYKDYADTRVMALGTVQKTDPIMNMKWGEAVAGVKVAINNLKAATNELYQLAASGHDLTLDDNLSFRLAQVKGGRMAVEAINTLYLSSGSAGIHERLPNERYWRDLMVANTHICNITEGLYTNWAVNELGGQMDPKVFL